MLLIRFFRFFKYLNFTIVQEVLKRTFSQRLPGLAAEMTYHLMLSLFPAIMAFLAAIGLFNPLKSTFQTLLTRVAKVVPDAVASVLNSFIQELLRTESQSLFSLSFFFWIWSASAGMSAGMYALDKIQQIPEEEMRPFWQARLVSILLTIGTMFLLISALALVFITDVFVNYAANQNTLIRFDILRFWQRLSLPLALGIAALTIAFIYRYGPSRWIAGTPILPGAILATLAWAILSQGFKVYVASFGNFNRVYGAVGGFIVLQLWVYLSCLVLLIGNQLNIAVGEAMQRSKMWKI
ncbi:YihY/virulence factor BrkB family protein [Phormidium sp. LEGE 05292]|uniref:YihY/virulence factor BrkB family protein n=1 Tax=[Phormidium] sp. LEGE 05292 TaxID=767427 RepID=UPI00188280B2|nr:YihY/virulence factor BrkB family protein [Phormidium sp. LEGE 05292]MBE9225104.1 YihY/virulence factor BrkB family protein [Phormidium sp. LEGE 05292]